MPDFRKIIHLRQSVGSETTFAADLTALPDLLAALQPCLDEV